MHRRNYWTCCTFLLGALEFRFTGGNASCTLPQSRPPRGYYALLNGQPLAERAQVEISVPVQLVCRTGFAIADGPNTTVCRIDGVWEPSLAELGRCISPQSQPYICTVPFVPNGVFRPVGSSTVIIGQRLVIRGGRIELTCSNGLPVVEGASIAECNSTYHWSKKFGHCGNVTCKTRCDEIKASRGGSLQGTGRCAGSKVGLVCQQPFLQIGNPETTCSDDGQWVPDIGQCVRMSSLGKACDEVPALENAVVLGSALATVGDDLSVECTNDGQLGSSDPEMKFLRFSDHSLRCDSDGKWSQWTGKCSEAKQDVCGKTPNVTGGYIEDGEKAVGSTRPVKCNDTIFGIVLGAPNVTCCWNGQWTEPGICTDRRFVSGSQQFYLQQALPKCPLRPNETVCSTAWFDLLNGNCNGTVTSYGEVIDSSQAVPGPHLTIGLAFVTVLASLCGT